MKAPSKSGGKVKRQKKVLPFLCSFFGRQIEDPVIHSRLFLCHKFVQFSVIEQQFALQLCRVTTLKSYIYSDLPNDILNLLFL